MYVDHPHDRRRHESHARARARTHTHTYAEALSALEHMPHHPSELAPAAAAAAATDALLPHRLAHPSWITCVLLRPLRMSTPAASSGRLATRGSSTPPAEAHRRAPVFLCFAPHPSSSRRTGRWSLWPTHLPMHARRLAGTAPGIAFGQRWPARSSSPSLRRGRRRALTPLPLGAW
jgi:hypothetical protein